MLNAKSAVMARLAVVVASVAIALVALPAVAQATNISQTTVNTLVSRAASSGGAVESVEAIETTAFAAEHLLNPHVTSKFPLSSGPVTLVEMHGDFIDGSAPIREQEPEPTGSVITYAVDSEGEIKGESCCTVDTSPSFATAGFAVEHMVPEGKAVISRAGHRTFHRGRARGYSGAAHRAGHHLAHAASWGAHGECEGKAEPENRHCYVGEEWDMSGKGESGKGEEVAGADTEQQNNYMWIPEWNSEGHEHFITNEEWVSLPLWNSKGEETRKWIETGIMGGDCGSSECLSWFYAYSEGPKKLHVIEDIWAIEPATWAYFGPQALGHGEWCIYIEPNWEVQYACVSGVGFSNYATGLQVGMEAAESQQPGSAAKSAVNYTAASNGERRTWNTGEPFKRGTTMCWSRFNGGGEHYGNINYWTYSGGGEGSGPPGC